MALAAAFGSIVLYVVGMQWQPSAAFYLLPGRFDRNTQLPARAWELLIGSAAAVWAATDGRDAGPVAKSALRVLFLLAVACLLVVPFIPCPT